MAHQENAGRVNGECLETVFKQLDAVTSKLDQLVTGQGVVETLLQDIHQALPRARRATWQAPRKSHYGSRAAQGGQASHGSRELHRVSGVRGDGGPVSRPTHQSWEPTFWPRHEFHSVSCSILELGTSSSPNIVGALQSRAHKVRAARSQWQWTPIHPNSWGCAAFDTMVLLVLLYDSITIPYFIAWDQPFQGWIAVLSWSTTTFWFADLLQGFLTGYHQREMVVMDFRMIAKHYLLTGFVPSLLVFTSDLVGNIMEMRTGQGALSKEKTFVKLIRFVKLNRVLRLRHMLRHGKVAQAWDIIATLARRWGVFEQFSFMTSVCKLVFCIMWVNHLVGCLWHMIGKKATAKWYDDLAVRTFGDDSFEYMVSFYWSASSMIAGDSIMTPTTTSELMATVFCVVFGFIFSSVLISSLLTTVLRYQDSNREPHEKLQKLRQFLYQHKVKSWLAIHVVKQVNKRMAITTKLSEGDVAALQLLSPMMRSELWCHIYGPSLMQNPFIRACSTMHDGFIKDVCFRTIKHTAFGPGSSIFEPGAEAVGAHFVSWGAFEYMLMDRNIPGGCPGSLHKGSGELQVRAAGMQTVEKGAWLSHVALLAHWLHRGWLDASQASEMLTIQAEPFVVIITSHPDLTQFVWAYSNALLKALEGEPAEDLSDINVHISHESVVAAMPLGARVSLSSAAFEVLCGKNQWSGQLHNSGAARDLQLELESGECDLMVDSSGEVCRSVTIVALRLRRSSEEDAPILMQVGKVVHGTQMVKCQPPGTKVKVGENPRTAVERLVSQKLSALSGDIHLDRFGTGRSTDEEDRHSMKYGVRSKYLRTVFEAVLSEPESDYKMALACGAQDDAVPSIAFAFEAFVFRRDWEQDAEPLFLYAWLPPKTVSFLEGEEGARMLERWVAVLDLQQQNAPFSL
mmetsp:Transcript_1062/g.3801  ORF Transcript_1062/g.3801 Transcript_1062/m.3801 type:complete len:910 (+) Transcript_1062:54-2783(+)